MKTEIKDFRNEGDKKYVGFFVQLDNGHTYIIDKQVDLEDGKSDEDYIKEAYALAKDEIDNWASGFANVGKEWDVEKGAFKEEEKESSESEESSESK